MNASDIILLCVSVTAAVLGVRFLPTALDAIVRSAAGEPASLLPRGFMPLGLRLRRTYELQTIVSRLALITRLNLPLEAALKAVAKNEPTRRWRVFRDMSRMIERGVSVSEALQTAAPGCPDQLIATLRRAEAIGQLPRALSEQERAIGVTLGAYSRSTSHARHAAGYAALVMLLTGGMVAWHTIVLMPRFDAIFYDFEVSMPPITTAFVDAVDWFVPNGLFAILGLVVLMSLFGLARLLERDDNGPVTRTVAALRRALPITRSLDFGMGMAKVIRAMALSMRSGSEASFARGLPTVVSPTNHLRQRIERFAQATSDGIAPSNAAKDAGLGDVFVCALRMVERGEDPQRVLGHAADYYEAIAYRWWHALMALSGPLVTLALAAMVGFIALALFTPLVALIDGVAETI